MKQVNKVGKTTAERAEQRPSAERNLVDHGETVELTVEPEMHRLRL